MDLFLVGDKLYFNEINWRSSANVYAAVESGNNYPFAWYLSATKNQQLSFEAYHGNDIYFMNEFWDFHHVLAHRLSLRDWLRDIRKTNTFAFGNKRDRGPFRIRLKNTLKNRFLRRDSEESD